MSYKIVKAPLIVDPDREFLNSLKQDPVAMQNHPMFAGDLATAVALMKSEGSWISSLVVSPALGSDAVAELIRLSFDYVFGAPVFFLCEPAKTKKDNESRAMVTQQVLEKPLTYQQILDWVKDSAEKTKKPRGSREKARVRTVANDEDFSSVTATSVLTEGSLSIDIYIKLRQNRYVRVVSAGDSLDDARLQRYLKKGLTEFHLRKVEQDNYKRTCEHLTEMLSASAKKEELDKAS